MKRRILLVDDEVAVLLTLKAVLEISGFDVDTAASAREGKLKLRSNHYHMVISDMRMESDRAGEEILEAAQAAVYHPAIALLTAYPLADEDWQELGADQMLVKPMHTRLLLKQIESLLAAHDYRLAESVAQVNAAAMDEPSAEARRAQANKAVKKIRKMVKKTRPKPSAKTAVPRKITKKPVRSVGAKKAASKTARKRTRRG
jgi:DNA-binding response OmpR family regulator